MVSSEPVDKGYSGVSLDEIGNDFYAFRIPYKSGVIGHSEGGISVEMRGNEVDGLLNHLRARLATRGDESLIDEDGFMGVHLDDQGGRYALYVENQMTGTRGFLSLTRAQIFGAISHIEKRHRMLAPLTRPTQQEQIEATSKAIRSLFAEEKIL